MWVTNRTSASLALPNRVQPPSAKRRLELALGGMSERIIKFFHDCRLASHSQSTVLLFLSHPKARLTLLGLKCWCALCNTRKCVFSLFGLCVAWWRPWKPRIPAPDCHGAPSIWLGPFLSWAPCLHISLLHHLGTLSTLVSPLCTPCSCAFWPHIPFCSGSPSYLTWILEASFRVLTL